MEEIKNITDINSSNHLTDSRSVAPGIFGPAWTFHGFGTVPLESRNTIDYIFIKNGISVLQVSVIYDMQGKTYLSDHNPVLLKASF